jgi:hypothetical protein
MSTGTSAVRGNLWLPRRPTARASRDGHSHLGSGGYGHRHARQKRPSTRRRRRDPLEHAAAAVPARDSMRVVAAASTDDEPLSAGAADETPPSAGQADETPPLAKTAEGGSPAQRRVMLPSEDLTRPGLTPWQVLEMIADPIP